MRSSVRLHRLAVPFAAALAAIGCTGPSDGSAARVRAELVRLPGASITATTAGPAATSRAGAAVIPWTSQVSLSSVRTPIVSVHLRRPDGTGTSVYDCGASSGAGCLVELNSPALQDLLGTEPVSVPVGTYDQVDLLYCTTGETGYRAFVTGTASIGGTAYYTRTAGVLGTTSPAEPVAIDHQGCGDSYPISPPLVIADSSAATTLLRLYFDILNLASAALPSPLTNSLWIPGGCAPASPPGSAPFLCAAYPAVIGVVGTTPPSIERYRVNDGGTIGLVFDAGSDGYYGGYLRRYVVEDQSWNPGFTPDGGIRSLTSNGDGSYRMEQGAFTSGAAGALFPAWRRATHSGTISYESRTTPYSAVRLP